MQGWDAYLQSTGLSPDRNVLLFTLGISALAAVAFGLAPLWSAVNAPVAGVLRAGATNLSADRRRAHRSRRHVGHTGGPLRPQPDGCRGAPEPARRLRDAGGHGALGRV